jgi:SAM-dependent methyltransferase
VVRTFPAEGQQIATFRDPAGSLRIEKDRVLRVLHGDYADSVLGFVRSATGEAWADSGRLVRTTILPETEADGGRIVEHPRIFFPSYPWEWTPGQWIAAGDLTLDLCEDLLANGLILKDATPLNVLFDGPHPVFVDVASVERRDPESPVWMAWAQFVRTFLLPLAAYKYLGWPLAASVQKRDGYEPADLYPHLSFLQRWCTSLRSLVTMPHLLEARQSSSRPAVSARKWKHSPDVALAVLRRNLRFLRRALHSLSPEKFASRWSTYPENAAHYSAEDHSAKQRFVCDALLKTCPSTVLDIGANTGTYSRIAASLGARVVAMDSDAQACERNWRDAQAQKLSVQPLVADVARPTPAVGWRNAESLSLLDRARGRFDCVLVLGLVHHLLLADQLPLGEIAQLLRDVTKKWLIVEWVPSADPKFQELLRGRDHLYNHLNEERFQEAFSRFFAFPLREPLKNGRVLFLMEAR